MNSWCNGSYFCVTFHLARFATVFIGNVRPMVMCSLPELASTDLSKAYCSKSVLASYVWIVAVRLQHKQRFSRWLFKSFVSSS